METSRYLVQKELSSPLSARDRAVAGGRILTEGDTNLFTALGAIDHVSFGTLGDPLQKGDYNVRVATPATNPELLRKVRIAYIGCADKRLGDVPELLAAEFGVESDEVLPIVIAGGSIQPNSGDIGTGLNTSFTPTSREGSLQSMVDYVAQQTDNPLHVVLTAHDGNCAFVSQLFGGRVDQVVPLRNEQRAMRSILVAHSASLTVPGITTSVALISPPTATASLQLNHLNPNNFWGTSRIGQLAVRRR